MFIASFYTSSLLALPYVNHRVVIEVLENRFEGMQ